MFGWGWNWFGGLWMIIWWAIVLGVIALAVYGLLNVGRRETLGGAGRPDPLRILKERYARGEITAEEYRRMKDELKE